MVNRKSSRCTWSKAGFLNGGVQRSLGGAGTVAAEGGVQVQMGGVNNNYLITTFYVSVCTKSVNLNFK